MSVLDNMRLLETALERRRSDLVLLMPQFGNQQEMAALVDAMFRPGTKANAVKRAICYVIADELERSLHDGR